MRGTLGFIGFLNSFLQPMLYVALIWSAKIFTLQPCCRVIMLRIQALKQYVYHYIDLYLKDGILALSWGA